MGQIRNINKIFSDQLISGLRRSTVRRRNTIEYGSSNFISAHQNSLSTSLKYRAIETKCLLDHAKSYVDKIAM